MPIGRHLAKCLTCFQEFVCGDCIESECKECQCKRLGHLVAKGISICCRCGVPNDPGDYVVECSRCGPPITEYAEKVLTDWLTPSPEKQSPASGEKLVFVIDVIAPGDSLAAPTA